MEHFITDSTEIFLTLLSRVNRIEDTILLNNSLFPQYFFPTILESFMNLEEEKLPWLSNLPFKGILCFNYFFTKISLGCYRINFLQLQSFKVFQHLAALVAPPAPLIHLGCKCYVNSTFLIEWSILKVWRSNQIYIRRWFDDAMVLISIYHLTDSMILDLITLELELVEFLFFYKFRTVDNPTVHEPNVIVYLFVCLPFDCFHWCMFSLLFCKWTMWRCA